MNLSRQRLWKAKARVAYWQRVKAYFGSLIVAIYPLTQDANDKSGNNLHGTAANVTFDSSLGALFNGTSSKINIYSAALNTALNKSELSWSFFFTPTLASWTDGTTRRHLIIQADGSNFTNILHSGNNQYSLNYQSGGVIKGFVVGSQSFTTPTHIGLGVSKTYDHVRAYQGGIENITGPAYSLGVWAGALSSTGCVIGALNTTPTQVTAGYIRDVVIFNGEVTPSEMMMLASPAFTDPQPPSFTNLNPTARRFAWISDVHMGTPYNNNNDTWSGIIRHINAINPEFILDTGDMSAGDGGVPSNGEMLLYKQGMANCVATSYPVPGNHDLTPSGGYFADPTIYQAAGFSLHFTKDIGNFRIIGFTALLNQNAAPSFATIDAAEKTWLLGQLDSGVLGGQTPIIAAHCQGDFFEAAGGGWPTFWTEMAALGVKGMLSGHDHFSCLSAVKTGGIVQVMGPSLWGQGTSQYPGMCIVYVFDDHLSIEYKSARYPFSDYTPSTTPAYTTITINR